VPSRASHLVSAGPWLTDRPSGPPPGSRAPACTGRPRAEGIVAGRNPRPDGRDGPRPSTAPGEEPVSLVSSRSRLTTRRICPISQRVRAGDVEPRTIWIAHNLIGRLTHWRWERDIDAIFGGARPLGPWLSLWDEALERIGPLEEAWNHFDTLTEATKLLHNTRIPTQPWKTGLPADYHQHAPRWPEPLESLPRVARRAISRDRSPAIRYQPHPDPRQERLFFRMLRECLEEGTVTRWFLRRAIRRRYLRRDALVILDGWPGTDATRGGRAGSSPRWDHADQLSRVGERRSEA
jgi:hypothetical protein